MEANAPMFYLKPADGAIEAQVEAVRDCHRDLLNLARQSLGPASPELAFNCQVFNSAPPSVCRVLR